MRAEHLFLWAGAKTQQANDETQLNMWLKLRASLLTVRLNSKLFSEMKLQKIEPLKSCPEAISTASTRESENSWPGLWLPRLLRSLT